MWLFMDFPSRKWKPVHSWMEEPLSAMWRDRWEAGEADVLRFQLPDCPTSFYKVKWFADTLWQQRGNYDDPKVAVAWKKLKWVQ